MGKILIVEDEPLLRFVTAETLRAANLDVVDLASADEAINYLLSETDVDLVFTDVNMPGAIDGLALAKTVKENYPQIEVILTSGRPRSPAELNGLPFVAKQYHVDEVIELIRERL